MFTPDPTVNGAWTHTRADVPLFRSAASPAATSPAQIAGSKAASPASGANGGFWQNRHGQGHGYRHGGMKDNPAFQQWRTSMDTWRQQRPARPDFRSMLASALEKD